MATKHLSGVEIKDVDRGLVEAVFATFGVVDSDGDVTEPGAFPEGAVRPISAYGHSSWEGALPVGKAKIVQTAKEARVKGQFFMNTAHGRDTFTTVKELAEDGLGEWSYGYDPLEYHFGEFDGRQVRFLTKVGVHEVSPVLIGAGVNTRTLSAKQAQSQQDRPKEARVAGHAFKSHSTPVVTRPWDVNAIVSGIPDTAGIDALRSVFAWSTTGIESKASYRFPHHHGVDGPANVRAVLQAIAVVNGATGDPGIPETDRKAVYDHLAAHLADADRDVPEFRPSLGGEPKFFEEAVGAVVAVSNLLDSASRVVALRAEKGKTLSHVNVELLNWLDEDLQKLQTEVRALKNAPRETVANEFARFLAFTHRGVHV